MQGKIFITARQDGRKTKWMIDELKELLEKKEAVFIPVNGSLDADRTRGLLLQHRIPCSVEESFVTLSSLSLSDRRRHPNHPDHNKYPRLTGLIIRPLKKKKWKEGKV